MMVRAGWSLSHVQQQGYGQSGSPKMNTPRIMAMGQSRGRAPPSQQNLRRVEPCRAGGSETSSKSGSSGRRNSVACAALCEDYESSRFEVTAAGAIAATAAIGAFLTAASPSTAAEAATSHAPWGLRILQHTLSGSFP